MSSLLDVILEKTLEDLKGTKNYPESVHDKLTTLFTKSRITKNSVISVLESELEDKIIETP